MIFVQTQHDDCRTRCEASHKLEFLVRQGKRLGLLLLGGQGFGGYNDGSDFLDEFREELTDGGGQYLSLDFSRYEDKSVAETLLAELEAVAYPQRINLPLTLTSSPFIHRAITWQRLCDRLIEDEEPHRPTLLVIENFDQADEQTYGDVERLIRFHIAHNVRRTFLLTLHDEEFLRPSLRRLVETRL